MFFSLTRPTAVLNVMLPFSRAIQTGVTCGEPSGMTVARKARFGASTLLRALSLSSAMVLLFQRAESQFVP
jgi:hypothetical protein